uniref:Predicted protein n=1 Tax=Hordeum vulgare subsp. vulgare TaxID=112509 RepID=F2E0X1_HORVV|nr:predicted protein [Hordeum vulgare subsp. vulgare]
MYREDEQSGRMEEIHEGLHSAYCQSTDTESADDISLERVPAISTTDEEGSGSSGEPSSKEGAGQPGATIRTAQPPDSQPELSHPTLKGLPVDRLRRVVRSLGFMIGLQKRGVSA